MNVLVTVLNAHNTHVSMHVRANKHVFLSVYDIKKAQLRGTFCKKHCSLCQGHCIRPVCVHVCDFAQLYCLLVVLTLRLFGAWRICAVGSSSWPRPGWSEGSAAAMPGQYKVRAAHRLPSALGMNPGTITGINTWTDKQAASHTKKKSDNDHFIFFVLNPHHPLSLSRPPRAVMAHCWNQRPIRFISCPLTQRPRERHR